MIILLARWQTIHCQNSSVTYSRTQIHTHTQTHRKCAQTALVPRPGYLRTCTTNYFGCIIRFRRKSSGDPPLPPPGLNSSVMRPIFARAWESNWLYLSRGGQYAEHGSIKGRNEALHVNLRFTSVVAVFDTFERPLNSSLTALFEGRWGVCCQGGAGRRAFVTAVRPCMEHAPMLAEG